MLSRNLCFCLLGATLAATTLTIGCRGDHDHGDRNDQPAPVAVQPAQPAPVVNETVVYNQWEAETHRAHVDLEKRTASERKEYQDWRDKRDHR